MGKGKKPSPTPRQKCAEDCMFPERKGKGKGNFLQTVVTDQILKRFRGVEVRLRALGRTKKRRKTGGPESVALEKNSATLRSSD